MFSVDNFYNIIHYNLIRHLRKGISTYFYPFGTYDYYHILDDDFQKHVPLKCQWGFEQKNLGRLECVFLDQEPWEESTFDHKTVNLYLHFSDGSFKVEVRDPANIRILANSEHSEFKRAICDWRKYYYNWYYFYHGFAALDWYRDFRYVEPNKYKIQDKVFICYNHLIVKNRSYRLHLVSNLLDQNLTVHGKISMPLENSGITWLQTITDPENPLDNRSRIKIYKALKNLHKPMVLDSPCINGAFSAKINFDDLTSALWHVVTETVYFLPKLHLTEKTFKPIIAGRPFILVAAPGNLSYLKSYGFKTFDTWIDESYDDITDHYDRIEAITEQIARLCALSPDQLVTMYDEMRPILDHNRQHFYGEFRNIIVDEMIDNFDHVLCQINNGRENTHSRYHTRFELPPGQLEYTRKLLKG